jgi:GTPase SAR1 family protein
LLLTYHSRETIERAINEIAYVRESEPDVLVVLVGNKSDLINQRQVSPNEGYSLAMNNNVPLFFEISALNKLDQVKTLVNTCASAVLHIRDHGLDNRSISERYCPELFARYGHFDFHANIHNMQKTMALTDCVFDFA